MGFCSNFYNKIISATVLSKYFLLKLLSCFWSLGGSQDPQRRLTSKSKYYIFQTHFDYIPHWVWNSSGSGNYIYLIYVHLFHLSSLEVSSVHYKRDKWREEGSLLVLFMYLSSPQLLIGPKLNLSWRDTEMNICLYSTWRECGDSDGKT